MTQTQKTRRRRRHDKKYVQTKQVLRYPTVKIERVKLYVIDSKKVKEKERYR